MFDQPSSAQLTRAIRDFLKDRVSPQLSGHDAYTLRVAINSLGIVSRELEDRSRYEENEKARLEKILQTEADIEQLNLLLCEKIRSEEFTLSDKPVFQHIKQTAIDQVKLDQPRYSGLLHALKQDV
jgi:hypothetical protein